MTIITRKRTKNFAIIPNAVAEDERLSFDARGLLCYLLVKPDNWKVDIDDIRRAGGIGRDKAYSLIKELRVFGYINLDIQRDHSGRISSQDYVVYDCAHIETLPLEAQENKPLPKNTEQAKPFSEKPEVVQPFPALPDTAEPDTAKPHGLIRPKKIIKIHSPLTPRSSKANRIKVGMARFEIFWNEWPVQDRPDFRESAMKVFIRLKDGEQESVIKHAASYRRRITNLNKKARMLPYLKQKLFKEYVDAPSFSWDGYFKITQDRQEWPIWLRHLRQLHGESTYERVRTQGYILSKNRWPETATESDKTVTPKQQVLAL